MPRTRRRAHLLFLAPLTALTAALAAVACGGISDPTHKSEAVATVSGALTGSPAPANARVALVWRNGKNGGVAVGADVPVVNGHFTMSLAVPADAYFFPAESSATPTGSDTAPGLVSPPSGGTAGSTGSRSIGLEDLSGQITTPLSVAVAGFVVYADANGNGALDLTGSTASTPDHILGGNKDLFVAYLRDGGSLDYEKLRDKSGILPAHGFNLAWKEGRWLGLDLVELSLASSVQLPSSVCQSHGTTFGDSSNSVTATPSSGPSVSGGRGPNGYPSPSDPNLVCTSDGRSYHYKYPPCTPPPSPPPGLCNAPAVPYACADSSSSSLAPGQTPPAGWPCPVAGAADAGVPSADASTGTARDGGAAPDAG
jgi:hypothetical protein